MPISFSGSAGFPQKILSSAIHFDNNTTITKVNIIVNITGSFHFRLGTSATIGGTITWEVITTFSSDITLTNPNKVIYYEIIGDSGAIIASVAEIPGVQITLKTS